MSKIEQKTLPQWEQKKNNIPGFGANRLTKTNVRLNTTGGGNYKIGYFTFNSTGNVSITGVGFTPKLVTFTYADQIGGYGTGAMDGTSLFGYDVLGAPSQIQSECIYLRNSGGTAIGRAVFVSMDADGFTINKTLASTTIYVNYIAFG